MDDIGTQWWSLDNIKNIPDECEEAHPNSINNEIEGESDKYLIFADYLIWCYAWAICCSDGRNRGRIALVGGDPDRFIAESFGDFVAFELLDAIDIHPGGSGA